jgi:hypothetical protein
MKIVSTKKDRARELRNNTIEGSVIGAAIALSNAEKRAKGLYDRSPKIEVIPKFLRKQKGKNFGSKYKMRTPRYKEVFPNRVKNIKLGAKRILAEGIIGGSTAYLATKLLNKLRDKK